jgi:hypothetical protein
MSNRASGPERSGVRALGEHRSAVRRPPEQLGDRAEQTV